MIWFTTQDKKSRKFKLSDCIGYRYGFYFQIAKITSHTVMLILPVGDIATNPGPAHGYNIQCLYLNARRLINKTNELQTITIDIDILAVTETWLKPENLDSEIHPGNDFIIYRQGRINRIGGGVLLAVRENILSLGRKDLESNEMLVPNGAKFVPNRG